MGEHGSESLGIQSRHEPNLSKWHPSPQLVAMRYASVDVSFKIVLRNGIKAPCRSRRAEYVCKHNSAADTNNSYVANGEIFWFDNKTPSKGDVCAAIAKSVFFG